MFVQIAMLPHTMHVTEPMPESFLVIVRLVSFRFSKWISPTTGKCVLWTIDPNQFDSGFPSKVAELLDAVECFQEVNLEVPSKYPLPSNGSSLHSRWCWNKNLELLWIGCYSISFWWFVGTEANGIGLQKALHTMDNSGCRISDTYIWLCLLEEYCADTCSENVRVRVNS